jgi:hypothetical protein
LGAGQVTMRFCIPDGAGSAMVEVVGGAIEAMLEMWECCWF